MATGDRSWVSIGLLWSGLPPRVLAAWGGPVTPKIDPTAPPHSLYLSEGAVGRASRGWPSKGLHDQVAPAVWCVTKAHPTNG